MAYPERVKTLGAALVGGLFLSVPAVAASTLTSACASFEKEAQASLKSSDGKACDDEEILKSERACIDSFSSWGDFIDTALQHGVAEKNRAAGQVADANRYLGMAAELGKSKSTKSGEFFAKASWAAGDAASSYVRCRAYASQIDTKYGAYKRNYDTYAKVDAKCRRAPAPASLSNTFAESDQLRRDCEKGGGDAAEAEALANRELQSSGAPVPVSP